MTTPRKRSILWDWTNTAHHPTSLDLIPFSPSDPKRSPISSLSNWNVWTPPELHGRVPFRPTVRTVAQVTDEKEWALVRDCASASASGSEGEVIVYFFNEPERNGIEVAEAARWWVEKMVGLRDELDETDGHENENGKGNGKGRMKLVSPACASDEKGEMWLKEWMALVEGMGPDKRPDFVGVHYYGTRAEEGIAYLEKIHATYPTYQLIISEIASTSRSAADVWQFTASMANWMDTCPWVFEYAFFGCMAELADDFVSPAARLMDGEGGLTPLMRALVSEVPMRERE